MKEEKNLKELKEETGIILNKDVKINTEKIKIYYKKSDQLKELTTYIIRLEESDLNIDINHKWEVSKEYLDKKEIYKAKFFTKKEAEAMTDDDMQGLANIIANNIMESGVYWEAIRNYKENI